MNKSTDLTILRFKQIREELHLTQLEFAKKLGVKSSTADIERGKTKISGQVIANLLKEFNINPLWLFGESHQQYLRLNQGDVSPKVVTVDADATENTVLVNIKAAAGYPQNVQDVEWYQQLPAFSIPLPEYRNASYRGFQVEGDSMLPSLEPKEWVIGKAVANISEISTNAIYVVVLQDSVMVKKLRKHQDGLGVTLISINPEYKPYEIDAEQIVELWEVNSKLSFNIDTSTDASDIKQLQNAIASLTTEVRGLKN